MTFVIGLQSEFYNIIASDTRISFLCGLRHRDGDHKTIKCELGLVSGSGWVTILEGVKKKLLSTTITKTDQITSIIQSVVRSRPKINYPTNFLVSYMTSKDGHQKLSMGAFVPDDYKLLRFEDDIYILPPYGLPDEEEAGYRELINKFRQTSLPPEGLLKNVVLIGQCFKEVSNKYGSVSPDLDITIMDINGDCHYLYLNSLDYLSKPLENFKKLSKGSYVISSEVMQET